MEKEKRKEFVSKHDPRFRIVFFFDRESLIKLAENEGYNGIDRCSMVYYCVSA